MDIQVITMKSILAAVLALFLYCSTAQADECVTVDSFTSAFAKEGIPLLGSKHAATERMAKVFNDNRAASGQPKAEISIFILGLVETKDGKRILAAIADENGCIVRDSIAVLPIRSWVEFMHKSGVTIDDFIPFDGA